MNEDAGKIFKLLRPERAPIVVGRQNPRQFEIIEGLQEGDRVVVSEYSDFSEAERLRIK